MLRHVSHHQPSPPGGPSVPASVSLRRTRKLAGAAAYPTAQKCSFAACKTLTVLGAMLISVGVGCAIGCAMYKNFIQSELSPCATSTKECMPLIRQVLDDSPREVKWWTGMGYDVLGWENPWKMALLSPAERFQSDLKKAGSIESKPERFHAFGKMILEQIDQGNFENAIEIANRPDLDPLGFGRPTLYQIAMLGLVPQGKLEKAQEVFFKGIWQTAERFRIPYLSDTIHRILGSDLEGLIKNVPLSSPLRSPPDYPDSWHSRPEPYAVDFVKKLEQTLVEYTARGEQFLKEREG